MSLTTCAYQFSETCCMLRADIGNAPIFEQASFNRRKTCHSAFLQSWPSSASQFFPHVRMRRPLMRLHRSRLNRSTPVNTTNSKHRLVSGPAGRYAAFDLVNRRLK